MRNFTPTNAQRAAIERRGSAILVSAGAGSGKTRVLTQRLMAQLCDPENAVDLDHFLIITFTRAAAGELRAFFYRFFQRIGGYFIKESVFAAGCLQFLLSRRK